MKTISIVIPTYLHYAMLHSRLYEIYQKCQTVLEVVVVDNGSISEEYRNGLEWWQNNGMMNVRHIRIKNNVGFIKAANIGIQRAIGDIVCLLSDDVKVGADLVSLLQQYLGSGQRALVGGRLIDWDSGWNTFDGKTYCYLEGWLLAASKESWKELGYLDEDLAPYDFEDVALSTKALQLEYDLVPLNVDAFHHLGGQTIGFNPDREHITNHNREIFRSKYVK